MAEPKFYLDKATGAVVISVNDAAPAGLELLEAGSTDAATEKHVPALSVEGKHLVAQVGEVAHPMLEEHYIQWIAFVSNKKTVIKHLNPGEEPKAQFCKAEDEHGAVYEYCNLHGLWKAEF